MPQPKFSVIIPVLHEAERINSLIEHLSHIDRDHDCEFIIADGSREEDTLKVIESNNVIKLSSGQGRARQMNRGASVARGEILIFLHADTELPDQGLKKIEAALEKREVMAGAFHLAIRSEKFILKTVAFLANLRCRLNRIPYGDQALFIRKEDFDGLGGFEDIPLMEDVALMRRIKKEGGKIEIIPDRVTTSPRRWEKEGVIHCTLRNWTLFTFYLMGVSPERLVKFYYKKDPI
jgi:rSAM/selenodomain-associated transferase 2